MLRSKGGGGREEESPVREGISESEFLNSLPDSPLLMVLVV